jgi:hypothetical protein
MDGFGYKTGWLAIRDGDADAVLAELGGEPIGTDRVAGGNPPRVRP